MRCGERIWPGRARPPTNTIDAVVMGSVHPPGLGSTGFVRGTTEHVDLTTRRRGRTVLIYQDLATLNRKTVASLARD